MAQPRPDIDNDYASIKARLYHVPATWYPGLLRVLVTLSYKAGCWQPGGAAVFVRQVEESLGLCDTPKSS